jgi:hypothetical protein
MAPITRMPFCLRTSLLALTFPLLVQSPLHFEFDVASVKPVKDCGSFQRFRNTPGALEVLNMQPSVLIMNAYRLVMEGQLTGEPRWAEPGTSHATRQGRGTLLCTSCSLSTLAVFLSNFLKRPVHRTKPASKAYMTRTWRSNPSTPRHPRRPVCLPWPPRCTINLA